MTGAIKLHNRDHVLRSLRCIPHLTGYVSTSLKKDLYRAAPAMQSLLQQRSTVLRQGRLCAPPQVLAVGRQPAAGPSSRSRLCTCAGQKQAEELSRIRFRKGLSFKERQPQRSRLPPVIEAAADAEHQIAWAAGNRIRRALDFRLWTARGKGLVLLNLLVRAQLTSPILRIPVSLVG